MNITKNAVNNEKGSVLVIALVILVLITLMGIMVTTTSDIDIQIAKNEQQYMQEFYAAESAWREAIQWLDGLARAPEVVNRTLYVSGDVNSDVYKTHALNVRNFGDGGNGQYNVDFSDPATSDGTLGSGPQAVNYWYRIAYLKTSEDEGEEAYDQAMRGDRAPGGFGEDFRQYNFVITGVANGTQRIDVTVSRVFRIGS